LTLDSPESRFAGIDGSQPAYGVFERKLDPGWIYRFA